MKAFIAVFAIVLLAFGASILYYRGDFGASSKPVATTTSQTQSTTTTTPPSNPGTAFDITRNPLSPATLGTETTSAVAPTYLSLTINQDPAGSVKEQASVNLRSVAKDKNGAMVSVVSSWAVADASIGSLSGTSGTDVTLVAKKAGRTKVTASYQSLTATVTITVIASEPVLGAATTTPPVKPTPTPEFIMIQDTTSNPSNRTAPGGTRSYSAQVLYSDNSTKTVDVNWSLNPGDAGSLSTSKGSSVTFIASKTYPDVIVTAALGNISAKVDFAVTP